MSHPPPGLQALPLSWADLSTFDTLIDTRSPAEFALDHLPGAVNYPVLDDTERAQVGTLYAQVSAFEAKKVGAAMVARNIAQHIDIAFRQHPKSWRPLIYCWRGGARSGAMTHILRSIGWGAVQLEGGYKAWRRQVIADLATLPARFRYQVICGRTGSGKSRLLTALAAQGAQVLDMEQLAAHKGSVLGGLPDTPQPSQKQFESRIWAALNRFSPDAPIIVEAESRKVGSLRVPQALLDEMWQAPCIALVTPDALRVRLLREEYVHLMQDKARLFFLLESLQKLHAKSQIAHWKALAEGDCWDEFVADLLINHYDPAYNRSMFSNYRQAATAAPLRVHDVSEAGFGKLAAGWG